MKKILAILFSLLLICALLAGCGSLSKDAASNSSYYDSTATAEEGWYDEESTAETPAESTGAIGSAPTGEHDPAEKIIYTANARVETTEFDDALQTAYSLIETAGGYIQSSYISGNSYNQIYRYGASYKSADLVIRVPSENFKSLTDSFSAVGNVLYVEYAQDNITTQYYNVQTRLDAYNAEHDRLIEMMQQADNVSDMILVEERLSEVEYQIDALSTSLRGMQKDVDYSTVTGGDPPDLLAAGRPWLYVHAQGHRHLLPGAAAGHHQRPAGTGDSGGDRPRDHPACPAQPQAEAADLGKASRPGSRSAPGQTITPYTQGHRTMPLCVSFTL